MKIAILTLPLNSNNYGGILQNWALQQVLKRLGHSVETINRVHYVSKPNLKDYFYRICSFFKCVIRVYVLHKNNYVISNPFTRTYRITSDLKIQSFVKEHIQISEPLYSSEELSDYILHGGFDFMIIGSDQVWRKEYSPCITDYFCGMLPCDSKLKILSYAASMGIKRNDYLEEDIELYSLLLSRFRSVSVREYSAQETLNKLFKVTASLVLDPTLLLYKDDYISLIEPKYLVNESQLTSYILDDNEDKTIILNETAKEIKLPIKKMNLHRMNDNVCQSLSEWLASFYSAKFVVTDSFHGCVFSIIFNIPFIAIANKDRGVVRFDSLLKQLNLQDRLVFSYDDFKNKKNKLLSPIDYTRVNIILDSLKSESYKFLKESIN